jgi:hypothetical protein
MTVSRVWILDSINFRVRPIQTLPYSESANGTFDFEVCILPRDGKKYSTQVRYMTTHGAVSYTISNFQAPGGVSSVSPSKATNLNVSLYPNPTTAKVTVQGKPGDKWSIANLIGTELLSGTISNVEEVLDLHSLPRGHYVFTVRGEDGESRFQKLVLE